MTFPAIQFRDPQLLLQALAQIGYGNVEQGEALPLFGYKSDQRPETAEIVIRRENTGIGGSNDIGFTKTDQGYMPIVSEYDQRNVRGGRFLADVRTSYSELTVQEVARRLNGSIQKSQDGQLVRMKVRF